MPFDAKMAFAHLAALVAAAFGAAVPVDLAKIGMNQPLDPALQPALVDVLDQAGLPRVLLIGDSISIGYTREVRTRLAGRANVHRPGENAGPMVLGRVRLDTWLGAGPWAVIHFNFGLHDLKYLDGQGNYVTPDRGRPVATPEQYGENLRAIVARLRRSGARLIRHHDTRARRHVGTRRGQRAGLQCRSAPRHARDRRGGG